MKKYFKKSISVLMSFCILAFSNVTLASTSKADTISVGSTCGVCTLTGTSSSVTAVTLKNSGTAVNLSVTLYSYEHSIVSPSTIKTQSGNDNDTLRAEISTSADTSYSYYFARSAHKLMTTSGSSEITLSISLS